MFNIGPGELMAIAAVALIVLGPQRLPQAMRQVGKFVGELRRISGGFQDELRRAIDESDVGDEADDEPEYRAVAIEATTTDNAQPAAAAPADAPSDDAPPADATVEVEAEDEGQPTDAPLDAGARPDAGAEPSDADEVDVEAVALAGANRDQPEAGPSEDEDEEPETMVLPSDEDEDDEPEAMVLPSDPPELPTRPSLPSRSGRRVEEPSANGDGPTGDERAVS
jgi:sec-independent protein translocase protein TatB